MEEKENTEARENMDAKEHYRARGRFRMRRKKSTSDVKKNVERQSSRGICDKWRRGGEHKWSTSRSMRNRKMKMMRRMSESEKCEDERGRVAPTMGAGRSHPQATSRPERGKHWDVKCVKENVRERKREEQVEKEAQEAREWQEKLTR